MSLISIITAVYRPEAEFLMAAYDSVRTQVVPAGWSLEWIVQEDGDTGIAEKILPGEDWIKFGTGRHNGVAITRNLGLGRSRGAFIKDLDQDDVLTAGVVERDIRVLMANRDIGWTTSRVLDLLSDGSTAGFDNDPPAGRIAPGSVLEHWRSHNYRLPVHPATMCVRRELVTALGGWMAVPGSDDTGMLIAASVVSAGYFHPEVGLLYRKWPGQESAKAPHYEQSEWQTRMSLISERADAIKTTILPIRLQKT
ncbi:glycosyltransferase [Mycobacteroides chelonae]|nr:glycosyltransferase [Mycobacteroides chelonae]